MIVLVFRYDMKGGEMFNVIRSESMRYIIIVKIFCDEYILREYIILWGE